jgi:hypothetical protein
MSDLWLARLARTSTDEQKKEKTVDAQIMQSPHEIKRRHLLIEDGGQWQLFIRNPLAHRDDRSNFFCDEGYNLESLDGDYEIVEMLELIKAGLINGIYMDNSNRLLRSTKAEIRGRIVLCNNSLIDSIDLTIKISLCDDINDSGFDFKCRQQKRLQ